MQYSEHAKNELRSLAIQELKKQLQTELKERQVNPLFLPIISAYLEGKTPEQIAQEIDLEPLEVSLILERNEVKRYCDQVVSSFGLMNRLKRAELINKVIERKIMEAEEYDAPLSNKDLLDWVKVLQEEAKMLQNQAPKTAVQINQTGKANIVTLMQELLDDDS